MTKRGQAWHGFVLCSCSPPLATPFGWLGLPSSVHKLQRKWHKNNWPCCCCCCWYCANVAVYEKRRATKVTSWGGLVKNCAYVRCARKDRRDRQATCNACKTIILTRQWQRQLQLQRPSTVFTQGAHHAHQPRHCLPWSSPVTHWPVARLAAFWLLCTLILIFNCGNFLPRDRFDVHSRFFFLLFSLFSLHFTLHLTDIHLVSALSPFSLLLFL